MSLFAVACSVDLAQIHCLANQFIFAVRVSSTTAFTYATLVSEERNTKSNRCQNITEGEFNLGGRFSKGTRCNYMGRKQCRGKDIDNVMHDVKNNMIDLNGGEGMYLL